MKRTKIVEDILSEIRREINHKGIFLTNNQIFNAVNEQWKYTAILLDNEHTVQLPKFGTFVFRKDLQVVSQMFVDDMQKGKSFEEIKAEFDYSIFDKVKEQAEFVLRKKANKQFINEVKLL